MGADLGRSERRFIDIDKIIDLEGDRSGNSINNFDHFKDFLDEGLGLQTEHATSTVLYTSTILSMYIGFTTSTIFST